MIVYFCFKQAYVVSNIFAFDFLLFSIYGTLCVYHQHKVPISALNQARLWHKERCSCCFISALA
ncbi:hypothetical protein C1H71_14865 [Iodobacter fluviatilis]|uniref:Uncharacterized protein n=1 Tax=Iodobacter fluviatilis TaxID=537 RepID=A0A7G3GC01_9NEIS|nr:hypothetical protein C1H71_14865 [Iodobacter fluviatilis]